MDKEYDIVAVLLHLEGIDNVVPLVEWAKANPDKVPRDGISCKHAVMMYYAKNIWYACLAWAACLMHPGSQHPCPPPYRYHLGKFTDIDANQDGRITREEFAQAAAGRFHIDIVPLVVDAVFSWVCIGLRPSTTQYMHMHYDTLSFPALILRAPKIG